MEHRAWSKIKENKKDFFRYLSLLHSSGFVLNEICLVARSNGIKALVQSLFENLTIGQNQCLL
jgi:hypothetical protein